MDTAPVSDDVSMEARVHARVVVVIVMVVVVIVVVIVVVVVVVFWRRSAATFSYFAKKVEAQLVPARGAAIRAVSRGNCGFVCICKRVYLQELPGGGGGGHCAARGFSADGGPFFRVGRETTSGPAERVFTHTGARGWPRGVAHECGVKQNAT